MLRQLLQSQLPKFLRKNMLFLILLVIACLPYLTSVGAADTTKPTSVVDNVFKLLQDNHVSGITAEKLSENAIKGMVAGLDDPYTAYFTPKEWASFESSLEQNYVGIGVRLNSDTQGVFITEIFKDSPAEAAGIEIGDYIIAVEGKSTKGLTIDNLIELVLGEENTKVIITVLRANKEVKLTMPRKKINLPIVIGKQLEDGTGYIQLTSFSSEADDLFAAKLKELQQNKIDSLVIDLRNNGGGLLDTASNIAKLFIKDGVLIHTNDRDHIDHPVNLKGGSSVDFPVYILLNQHSASASEVLAGALQDYGLATVIGTQSFGKGSVQSIFPLSNGGVLKVTIEEYLTPKNHKVNEVGITPNIESLGGVPQLITALKTAGLKDIKLTRNNNEISINKHTFSGESYLIQTVNNKTYVPSRVLAAMIEGKITWDLAAKAVKITTDKKSEVFPTSSTGTLFLKGTTYLELTSFSAKFPQLQWSMDKELLTLQVKGK